MSKAWRDWPDQCDNCGNDVEVLTDAGDEYVYDGDEVRCVECGLTGWMSADEGDTWVNWNEPTTIAEWTDEPTPPEEPRRDE